MLTEHTRSSVIGKPFVLNSLNQKTKPMLQTFFAHAPWLQIIVAGLAYFVVGAIWYARPVFGNYWAAQHNVQMTEESKKKIPMIFGSTLLLNLLMAVGMAMALYAMQAPGTCMHGIKTGLFLGGVFCALPMGINYLYTGKPFKLWFIDAGYHVVGITLMGIILSVWR
jgi:hypothetical protein